MQGNSKVVCLLCLAVAGEPGIDDNIHFNTSWFVLSTYITRCSVSKCNEFSYQFVVLTTSENDYQGYGRFHYRNNYLYKTDVKQAGEDDWGSKKEIAAEKERQKCSNNCFPKCGWLRETITIIAMVITRSHFVFVRIIQACSKMLTDMHQQNHYFYYDIVLIRSWYNIHRWLGWLQHNANSEVEQAKWVKNSKNGLQ